MGSDITVASEPGRGSTLREPLGRPYPSFGGVLGDFSAECLVWRSCNTCEPKMTLIVALSATRHYLRNLERCGALLEELPRCLTSRDRSMHSNMAAYSNLGVIPGEDPKEFARSHQSLIADLDPSGPIECDIVLNVAKCSVAQIPIRHLRRCRGGSQAVWAGVGRMRQAALGLRIRDIQKIDSNHQTLDTDARTTARPRGKFSLSNGHMWRRSIDVSRRF